MANDEHGPDRLGVLKWLNTNTDLTGKFARWAIKMQEYEFTIENRPGVHIQLQTRLRPLGAYRGWFSLCASISASILRACGGRGTHITKSKMDLLECLLPAGRGTMTRGPRRRCSR
jgi:hypothetical protein